MAKNQGVKFVIAMALFAAAAFLTWKFWPSDKPEGAAFTYWVCLSPKCGHEFQLTAKEKMSYVNRDVPCPKCGGTETNDAYKCPHCSQLYMPEGHGAIPEKCPKCKASLKAPKPGA